MKKIILQLLFVAGYLSAVAQMPNSETMVIKAETQVSGKGFNVGISDMGKQIKLVYKVKDSLSLSDNANATLAGYLKAAQGIKNFSPTNDTLQLLLQKADSVRQLYTHYSIDSMVIRKQDHAGYAKLIEQIMQTPIDNLMQIAKSHNLIVMDGTSFTFLWHRNGHRQTVEAHSPMAESHPLLASLVKKNLTCIDKSILRVFCWSPVERVGIKLAQRAALNKV